MNPQRFHFLQRWALLAAVTATLMSVPAMAQQPVAAPEEMLLQVTVNGLAQGDDALLLLREKDGTVLLAEKDLQRSRIRLPETSPRMVDGTAYYRIADIENAKWSLDEGTQQLALTVPGSAFERSSFANTDSSGPQASRPAWGGFFSYDVLAEHSSGTNLAAGTFEAGLSGPLGILTTDFLARKDDQTGHGVRLNSTWTYDRPDRMASLRIGDTISRSASGWGQSVRFGGIQYATNFTTQPGLVLLPQQSVSGTAVVPSTVDVFINNSLVSKQQVPAGPFSIGNIPIMAGPGQMQVVVRDQMGREQIIQSQFFGTSYLLRQGLTDYSFEAGALRSNFGLLNSDYGQRFAAGTWRRGLSSWFTGELHAEAAENGNRAVSAGSAVLLGNFGVANATVASSASDRGTGALYGIGLTRQGERVGASVTAQFASRTFWQLGMEPNQMAPKLLANATIGISLGHSNSLSLGYFRQEFREPDRDPVRLVTAGWSFLLPHTIFAGLNASRSLSDPRDTTVGLFFNIPLGLQSSSSTSIQRSTTPQGTALSGTTTLQKSLPIGEGWGYQVRAQDQGNVLAGASYQNNVGTYSADVASQHGQTAGRIGVQGSLITLGGEVFSSRRSTDSYALVRVPGFADVRVYNGNQLVGKTDKHGVALVPRLLAYQPNSLSIDEQDLPINAQVGDLQRTATPWFRSGIVIDFPVTRSLSAEMRVVDANGHPIAAGSNARLGNSPETFIVAADGLLYLVGLQPQNRVIIQTDTQPCVVEFRFTPGTDPLPDLGTLTCKGVTP